MRYYKILITNDDGDLVKYWDTSLGNGNPNPGALNVILDLPSFAYALPQGQAFLQLWGISLQDIAHTSDLNGLLIQIYGGMQKGLPLANPKQSGLLLTGRIFQCFGNWQGTEQNINFVIQAGGNLGNPSAPANIFLNWRAGTELSAAVDQSLSVAFPLLRRQIAATTGLIRANDVVAYYNSVTELAQYVKQASLAIFPNNGRYSGLNITIRDNRFLIYDNTAAIDGNSSENPKQLSFFDLIGQPTWYGFAQVSFKTVMRADISQGDWVQLPPAQYTTQSQSQSQYRNKSTFQGIFQVNTLRHVGNFRQSDANSWVTVIEAIDQNP